MKFLQSIREEKRLWSFSVVLGILFSMFFTLGRVLQKHTSLEEFDASDGVGLFLSFVIWSCVFIAFLKCGSIFVDEYRCRKQAGVIWDKNKIFWIAFGVIVVAYIPCLLYTSHVKKTRWTLPIALLSTLSGIIASVLLAKIF